MGNCIKGSDDSRANARIESRQKKDAKNRERKFLLLGPGESGNVKIYRNEHTIMLYVKQCVVV